MRRSCQSIVDANSFAQRESCSADAKSGDVVSLYDVTDSPRSCDAPLSSTDLPFVFRHILSCLCCLSFLCFRSLTVSFTSISLLFLPTVAGKQSTFCRLYHFGVEFQEGKFEAATNCEGSLAQYSTTLTDYRTHARSFYATLSLLFSFCKR